MKQFEYEIKSYSCKDCCFFNKAFNGSIEVYYCDRDRLFKILENDKGGCKVMTAIPLHKLV